MIEPLLALYFRMDWMSDAPVTRELVRLPARSRSYSGARQQSPPCRPVIVGLSDAGGKDGRGAISQAAPLCRGPLHGRPLEVNHARLHILHEFEADHRIGINGFCISVALQPVWKTLEILMLSL